MKTWKLLLLALVPGLWGWLCNWLTAVSLNGPAFLFTLAFYIQVPAAIVFCLWLGHLCGRSERSYPACLLLTQWPSLVSFALYVWQFHFVSSEARSFLLAGLGQYPGLPLFSLACRLVIPLFQSQLGAAGNLGGQCALPADAGGAVLPGLPMGPAEAVTRPPLLKNAPARAVRPGLVL